MESGPIGNAAAFIDISRLENKVQLVLHSGHARGFPLDRPVTYGHIGRGDRLVGIGAPFAWPPQSCWTCVRITCRHLIY